MSSILQRIEEPISTLYDPMGNIVGEIKSYLEFLSVRVQIQSQQIHGYYINWESQTICIDRNGECDNYPNGFYDQANDLLLELCCNRK